MRRTTPIVAVFFAGSHLFGACGGSQPPATQAPAAPGGGTPPSTAVAAGAGDAGPTTTTTQTLGGGPGTKLTAQPSDAGADASPKHRGELGRTIADIQAIVGSHRDDARACYDNALAAHPGIEETLDVRWTIDPTGKVTEADLDTSRSELVEPAVANCVIAIIKAIHFNASPKGFETKAHYPFNFHPRAHPKVNAN